MKCLRKVVFAEQSGKILTCHSIIANYFVLKREILIAVTFVILGRFEAQVPAGTILWSETWTGCEELVPAEEYLFSGTYTYGNAEIEYKGGVTHIGNDEYLSISSGGFFNSGYFSAKEIPTGNAPFMLLSFSSLPDINHPLSTIKAYSDSEVDCEEINEQLYFIRNKYGLDRITIHFEVENGLINLDDICLKATEPDNTLQLDIQPIGGSYVERQTISISCQDPEADVYYTTDGSNPSSENGVLYNSPFIVGESTQVKAIAIREGFVNNYAQEYYSIISPSFEAGGVYYEVVSIDDLTVSAIGLVDNTIMSISIPETVCFGDRAFTVTELDFKYDIGKCLKSIELSPLFNSFGFVSCDVDSLIIRCNTGSLVGVGQSIRHNKRIKIIGDNLYIVGGNYYPELCKLEIIGSGELNGFLSCPKLNYLNLGMDIFMNKTLANHEEFNNAPIDTLRVGRVRRGVEYWYGSLVTDAAFSMKTNYYRRIYYMGDEAIQTYSMGDSLEQLVIPSNVAKIRAYCAPKVNELVIEEGDNQLSCETSWTGHSFYFLSGTKAKKVFFDRNKSVTVLHKLTCEQLVFGQHVYSSGYGIAEIDVKGDSAFVQVYQVTPLTGISFSNNTYLYVPLYVPRGTKEVYEVADNWKNFFNIIEFDWEGPDCSISAMSNNTDYGIVNGSGTYHYGETVTLTAIPVNGCSFLRWTENGSVVSTDSIYSFPADRNRTIIGEFEENYDVCSVIVTSNNLEYGIAEGGGLYRKGDRVSLVALPNNGCSFMYWTSNGAIIDNYGDPHLSFYVYQNYSIVANFRYGTGIEEESETQVSVMVRDRLLSIIGAEENEEIKVFNGLGQIVYQGFNQSIRLYSAGVYIVAIKNKRIKVIVE